MPRPQFRRKQDQNGFIRDSKEIVQLLSDRLPHIYVLPFDPTMQRSAFGFEECDDPYRGEMGKWCRDQFGVSMIHLDLWRYWVDDAVWALFNGKVYFRDPNDCFAFQMRFR